MLSVPGAVANPHSSESDPWQKIHPQGRSGWVDVGQEWPPWPARNELGLSGEGSPWWVHFELITVAVTRFHKDVPKAGNSEISQDTPSS